MAHRFVDLAVDQGPLGQQLGRRSCDVVDWLTARGPAFCAGVTHVAIDPSAAYAAGVCQLGSMPTA